MHFETNLIIYFLAAIAIGIFIFGIIDLIFLWRVGKEPTLNTDIRINRWIKYFLKSIFFQNQIVEYGFLPWLTHIMIFYGFLNLFVLTSLQFFLTWLISSNTAIVIYFKTGVGNLGMAVWGDFWGLILLTGILLALFRRYVLKPEYFNTISEDAIAIWLLFIITVSGFLCEIIRLAVRPESYDAAYSFAVYWMMPLIDGFKLTETHLSFLFYLHGIISLIFIAYIPFSKFKHILTSPLTFAFVSAGSQYSKN